jgi:hypothetical protein
MNQPVSVTPPPDGHRYLLSPVLWRPEWRPLRYWVAMRVTLEGAPVPPLIVAGTETGDRKQWTTQG